MAAFLAGVEEGTVEGVKKVGVVGLVLGVEYVQSALAVVEGGEVTER